VNYFGLARSARSFGQTSAGFVSFYWGRRMSGRFLGGRILPAGKGGILRSHFCCDLRAHGSRCPCWWADTHRCGRSSQSMVQLNHFPTIFSLGEAELGPLTGSGSGNLNMAIVGGAIVPLTVGSPPRGPDRVGPSPRVCDPGDLLLVHLVLWPPRIEPKQRAIRKGLAEKRGTPMLIAGDIG